MLELLKTFSMAGRLLVKRPAAAAIDITSRCNLRCRHCYWWKQDHPKELDDDEIVALFEDVRSQGMRVAILYGGEPTLRPKVCEAAARIFDSVLIFTNGTLGLFALGRRAQWIVSLDGPRRINDEIRGNGTYDKAVRSIMEASRPPIVHITISRLNEAFVEDFVEDMLALPIKGIGFSFFTPNRGEEHNEYLIPLQEREHIIKRLLSLRRRFGEQVGFTEAIARQLRVDGDYLSWNSYERCPVSRGLKCFRSDGTVKLCTYGDDADCARCGCAAVSAFRGAFHPPNYESIRVVFGLLLPGFIPRAKKGNGAK